jgi:uncharacterized protein YqgV (UPF0045/DUF77 family)
MDKFINAAIQLLPLSAADKYGTIDKAIELIRRSGLKYRVCPFETVVEGTTDEVYALIRKIQEQTLAGGSDELLINVKIHAANRDLHFEEKTAKFE